MRTTTFIKSRQASLLLAVTVALAACGGAIRTSTIRGHQVRIDTSRGDARTSMRIDQCPPRELHYDTDFSSWGLDGEVEGALFESPEDLAAQLIATGYDTRCQQGRAPTPDPEPDTRPVLTVPPPDEPGTTTE